MIQAPAVLRGIGLPAWVLIGALLGIAAGVGLGERTAALAPIGAAYTMMLEIAIYPYLICSLLQGLGRLAPGRVGRLFRASWPVFVSTWILALTTTWLLSYALPPTQPPLVLRADQADAGNGLTGLVIPANLFVSLLNNDVPAVVVFAVLYGFGIQGLPQRQTVLDVVEAVRAASVRIWNWVVKLSPVGVFALLADTAGTLRGDQIGGFLLYNVLFLSGTLVLALVVLPLALTALAPTQYRELLTELRPGLMLAFVTTLAVVALPAVQRLATRVAHASGCPDNEETTDVIQASLSLAYVFAQIGNHFCDLLLFYAAFLARHTFTLGENLLLPFLTVLSCVGSPSTTISAVSFLAAWLHLPTNTTSLWVATSAVTRYGQVLLSVSSFAFVTSTIPLLYWRRWRLRWAQVAWGLGGGFGLLAMLIVLAVLLRPNLFPPEASRSVLARSVAPELIAGMTVTLERTAPPDNPSGAAPPSNSPSQPMSAADVVSIQRSGVLRVGYNPHVAPFSYWNAQGALAGYDISFAYHLAHDLNVQIAFIPFAWNRLVSDIAAGRFDIAMSGVYLTETRLASLTPGPTTATSPVALLVPFRSAKEFTSRASLLLRPSLRLAIVDSEVVAGLAHALFPQATMTVVPDFEALTSLGDQIDAALWTLDEARAWAESHPGWIAVVPSDAGAPLPMAYMLPPGAIGLQAYLDTWMQLQRENGFADAQRSYWIEGRPRAPAHPRWNLLDAWLGKG